MKKRVRLALGFLLIVLTIAVFAYYLAKHMSLLRELRHIPPMTTLWLLLLYGAWLGAIVLISQVTLYICRLSIPFEENILLNAYSTLTNFFVPGQGGIAVRGVYLKRQYRLSIRNYVISMLLYYACYALVSTFMLLAPSRPWWQTLIGLVVAGGIGFVCIRWYVNRSHTKQDGLNIRAISITYLMLATALQAVVQVAIYAVELHDVNRSISLHQVVTYTGAANFALFVALTPGAIGVREAFLVFSRGLHHISTANIVAASVIDRGIFLVFLGLLFVLTLSLHAKRKLQISGAPVKPSDEFQTPVVVERKG